MFFQNAFWKILHLWDAPGQQGLEILAWASMEFHSLHQLNKGTRKLLHTLRTLRYDPIPVFLFSLKVTYRDPLSHWHGQKTHKRDFRLYTWFNLRIPLQLGEGSMWVRFWPFCPVTEEPAKGRLVYFANRVAATDLFKAKPGWVIRSLISETQKQPGLLCDLSA